MTQEELYKIRGEIIDKLVHLDNAICILISMHYFSEIRHDFIYDVLYERSVPVASKKEILINIFRRKKLEISYLKDIDKLLEIRNIFAHAWIVDCGGVPDATDLRLMKNDEEEYDENALKKEFDGKHKKVIQYLFRIIGCDPSKRETEFITNQRSWYSEAQDVGKDGKTKFNELCSCSSRKMYKNCHGK